MFKVGDKGKTVGGWNYEIIDSDDSRYPYQVKHENYRYDEVDAVWHKPDGRLCCNIGIHGSDDWDLLPPDSHEEVEMPECPCEDEYSFATLAGSAAQIARDHPDLIIQITPGSSAITIFAA